MQMIRIRTLLVALALVLFGATAFAQDWGRVMSPSRPLNVRLGRSLNTDRVTTIMPGEKVRAALSDGDWIAVFPLEAKEPVESAAIGFVKEKYLEPAKDTGSSSPSWGKLVAPKGMLNVRRARDRDSAHVVTLKPGQVVRADFSKDEWSAVFDPAETVRDEDRAIGYARDKYLFPATSEQIASAKPARVETPKPAAAPQPVSVQPAPQKPAQSQWGKRVTLGRRANVREERTASSALVTTLDAGTTVRVDFLERGWYAVFRDNAPERNESKALGYVYAPLLDEPTGELTPHSLMPRPQQPEEDPLPRVLTQSAPARQPVIAQPAEETPAPARPQAERPAPEPVRAQPTEDGRERMVITPTEGDSPHKGPVPLADKVRHGFRYGVLERERSSSEAIGRTLIRIYLDVTVVPADDALSDFAMTLFREEQDDFKELLVLFYLPGQDTNDLAYAEARFSRTGLEEFWARKATLYGTGFM